MKKSFLKFLAGTAVLGAVCMTTAFAQKTVSVEWEKPDVAVSASTLGSGEETTILVVTDGTTISQAFADTTKIYYIDQTAASPQGVATFGFKYSGTEPLDIYIGYATMSASDVPLEAVVDESESGENPPTGTFMYGDVNNDGQIDLVDASAVINNFLHGTEFTDSSTEEVYEQGEAAANVNPDDLIDLVDASAIINNFLHGTEFPVNEQ